jgi:hypothetical protein
MDFSVDLEGESTPITARAITKSTNGQQQAAKDSTRVSKKKRFEKSCLHKKSLQEKTSHETVSIKRARALLSAHTCFRACVSKKK